MVKLSTGFVAKSAVAATVAAGASYGIAQNWAVVNGVASSAGNGLGQFGSFLKSAGILSVIGALLFISIKFNVLKVLTIQEGETGLLVRRGKVVIDKKTGLPRIVNSDRYQLHIAVWRHIAVVNNRERVVDLGSLPVTIGSETWVVPLVLVWSINGDPESMRDALTKVSDGNRFDEKFGALEKMIKEQTTSGLGLAFKQARTKPDGSAPDINYQLVESDLLSRINRYGCHFHELLESPLHRYDAQHNKDGMREIATAIRELREGLRTVLPTAA